MVRMKKGEIKRDGAGERRHGALEIEEKTETGVGREGWGGFKRGSSNFSAI